MLSVLCSAPLGGTDLSEVKKGVPTPSRRPEPKPPNLKPLHPSIGFLSDQVNASAQVFGWGIKVITQEFRKVSFGSDMGCGAHSRWRRSLIGDQDLLATLALAWRSKPNGGGGRTSNGDVNLHYNTRECVPHRML